MFRNDWQRTICDLRRNRTGQEGCDGCPYMIDRADNICQGNSHWLYDPATGAGWWVKDYDESERLP